MRRAAVVIVVLLVLGGCATDEEPPGKPVNTDDSAVECVPLSADTLDAISEGLVKEAAIIAGTAVKLAQPERNLSYIAALTIEDSTKQVGMLAMGGTEPGDQPWIAADNVAQRYLDWGEEEAKDGTPIKKAADAAWQSDQGVQARGCLKEISKP